MAKRRRDTANRFWEACLVVSLAAFALYGCATAVQPGGGNPKPAPLVITTALLPPGHVGEAFSTTLTASGGTPPYSWSISSGTLPAGLSLDMASGVLSGMPAAASSATVTFALSDSGNPVQHKSIGLTFTVSPATLAITTTSLPSGQVGAAYSANLATSGGTAPYSWTLTSGTLPAGLNLNASSGAITGMPTHAEANARLTFKVTDSENPTQTQSANLTLTIAPAALVITTTSLPGGQVSVPYSTTLAGTGGQAPYAWSITSGTLPVGLSLNASTGVISGTPTVASSNAALTIQVKDSSAPAQTKSANFTLTIVPTTLAITTNSLANGQVGVAYSATLATSGGTTPYVWSLISGTLPNGLSLAPSTGTIAGTPTVPDSNVSLTFKVTDSGSPTQSQTKRLSLTIAPAPLVITTVSLPNGQLNAPYSATLSATGGTTPYTWAITSGTLPAGLSFTASTGTIAGTSTVAVTNLALTLKVTDAESPAQTKSVNLTLTVTSGVLVITTTSLPNGQVGTAYNASVAATGGTRPYRWAIASGVLPSALSFNTSSGAITGTPSVAVTDLGLTFQVTDSSAPARMQTASLTLTVVPILVIGTTSLPNGQVATAYSATLNASGGTAPYTWTLTSGTLPSGLNLSGSTGRISGTPTAAVNNLPLTFQAKDSETPAQTKTVNLTLTITPAALAITTTSLPTGQVNVAYSATLAANGGTAPYTWTLTSGTLPAGLNLVASTGAITGTPTASATNTPLAFQVKDSGTPQQTKTVDLALTIGTGLNVSVAVSPKWAGLTVGQTITNLIATLTNDSQNKGVTWSISPGVSGNPFHPSTSASGVAVTFTAPSTPGVYTVTATSVSDGSITTSARFGVTNLTGVTTYHNNLSRDGTNTQEYALTNGNVTTATFGKLFSCTIDSPAYAQPLWVANLSIGGGVHNVVFVASSHDTVYAFDADQSPCVTYWSVSLLGTGETYLNSGDVGSADIETDIGIVGTPVIDLASRTLYVVSKSKDSGTSCTPSSSCHQRLHALNLADHTEKFAGPYDITSSITVPGNGDGSSNGLIPFNPLRENQRPGLALVNGNVYVAWASHGDNSPWHGWLLGFAANNIGAGPTGVWNSTPTALSGSISAGGIWMGGAAPAADSSNNLYFLTGNGAFTADSGGSDYGDSTVKLSTTGSLHVTDYFTPGNQSTLNTYDLDHGSGGAAILVDQPSGPVQHLLVGGGKAGVLFLLNRDNMGHYNAASDNVVQSLDTGKNLFATGAFWNNSFYIAATNAPLAQYTFNTATGQFNTSGTHYSPCCYYFPGSTPSVSSLGSTNGIVWALDNSQYCTTASPGCGPTVLHAYDATNVSNELWNSTQGSGNSAGNAVKFTVPTVANGKVYVPTRTELDIYGLLPN